MCDASQWNQALPPWLPSIQEGQLYVTQDRLVMSHMACATTIHNPIIERGCELRVG